MNLKKYITCRLIGNLRRRTSHAVESTKFFEDNKTTILLDFFHAFFRESKELQVSEEMGQIITIRNAT